MSKPSQLEQDYIDGLLVEQAMLKQGNKKERLAAVKAELKRVGYEEHAVIEPAAERAVVKRKVAKPKAPKAAAKAPESKAPQASAEQEVGLANQQAIEAADFSFHPKADD